MGPDGETQEQSVMSGSGIMSDAWLGLGFDQILPQLRKLHCMSLFQYILMVVSWYTNHVLLFKQTLGRWLPFLHAMPFTSSCRQLREEMQLMHAS